MTDTTQQQDGQKATGTLPASARVVVIGGGSVGCSVLYHLAKMGWTDCLLLEKNELTSGSTWHAAGNCPNFVGSWTMMKMQSYSTELYRRLGEEVDYPMNYHVTGAIRLAHSKERMDEFRHVQAMGRQMGVDFEMMSNADMQNIYPFLETHDLEGGQWDPLDGDIDPAQLTQALAKGARDLGAQIIRFCPVTGVTRKGDEWEIETPIGSVRAEYVVNAAGYRADEIGKMFGRDVPCVSLAHQYLVTEGISELSGREEKLPLLRDPDSSYYLRQEKDGLLLGPYEKNCRAHWVNSDDPRPSDFSFQLWNDDLERLEWYIDDACKRVPILGTAGITRVVNGPIPYAPDGLPLVGPMPGVPNAFECCVFTFGIVQAGGAGKLMAEIIIEGEPETDSWAVDPRRFTDHVDRAYSIAKAIETYSHEYATHYPQIQWPAGRPAKMSPLYHKLKDMGAEFGAYGGWERADWFPQDGDMREPAQSFNRQHWHQTVGAECRHVADHAGLIDLTGFTRFEVKGKGARAWLDNMVTGRLPKAGRIGLIYFSSPKGKTLTEMTATCFDDDHFWLITGAGAFWHDRDWLNAHCPDDGSVTITDLTRDMGSLLITGPKSSAIMEAVTGTSMAQDDFKWLTHREGKVAGANVRLIRVSFAGEAGWELHVPMSDMEAVYDELMATGAAHQIKPFGMLALDSMRLEKGYRSWKADLTSDYTMLESGLGRWVKTDKDNFIGRTALLTEEQRGASRRFVAMVVNDPADGEPFGEAIYLSSIRSQDKDVGLVVSAGYGHRVGKSIAYGIVDETAFSNGNPHLEVEILGRMRQAHIVDNAVLYDPDNSRLRA
ncbi:MAG TPA: dimethylglycine dehydrogenase [Alphaproteobacteria bacterium]|nr:dimethylglycine dehydrogenase [Alphaproteobacteria bacterium]